MDAKPVRAASAQLSALSKMPAVDLALVARYGPALHDLDGDSGEYHH